MAHAVFYGILALIILIIVGFMAWVHDYSYIYRLVPYVKVVSCIEKDSAQSCYITYTLTNGSNRKLHTDLNGINGPGPAESGVNDLNAILDDGTKVPIFAGSSLDYDGKFDAYESVELTDKFTIPKGHHVKTIEILNISFEITK